MANIVGIFESSRLGTEERERFNRHDEPEYAYGNQQQTQLDHWCERLLLLVQFLIQSRSSKETAGNGERRKKILVQHRRKCRPVVERCVPKQELAKSEAEQYTGHCL